MLRPLKHQREVARIEIVEHCSRTLIEHVRVNAAGLQQFDPALPISALLLQAAKFPGQAGKLLVEVLLCPQPVIPGVGIDAEIANHQRATHVEAKRAQNGPQFSPGDHAGKMR